EGELGVVDAGRLGDVAVPAFQRAGRRVDLEDVVPAVEVVPLVEDVALFEADVAKVAAIALEDGGEEKMIVVAVDLTADPAVALRAVVHQLLDDQRTTVRQLGGRDRRIAHARAS